MLGRFFLIALLLMGTVVVALYATRTGYRVMQSQDERGVTCIYWIGIGTVEDRHDGAGLIQGEAFECPLLLRDVTL